MEDLKHSETWRVFRIQSELVEGFETLNGLGPAVSIFGSSQMKPGSYYCFVNLIIDSYGFSWYYLLKRSCP